MKRNKTKQNKYEKGEKKRWRRSWRRQMRRRSRKWVDFFILQHCTTSFDSSVSSIALHSCSSSSCSCSSSSSSSGPRCLWWRPHCQTGRSHSSLNTLEGLPRHLTVFLLLLLLLLLLYSSSASDLPISCACFTCSNQVICFSWSTILKSVVTISNLTKLRFEVT